MSSLSIFSGANESEMMGGAAPRLSNYLGRHLLKIEQVNSGIAKGKNKGKAFYGAKVEVLKSTHKEAKGLRGLSWATVKSAEWPDYFFSDIKRFIGAVTGKGPEAVKEAAMQKSAAAEQPIKDRIVGAYVYPTDKLDRKGKRINQVEFFTADANTDLGEPVPDAVNEDAETGGEASEEEPLF